VRFLAKFYSPFLLAKTDFRSTKMSWSQPKSVIKFCKKSHTLRKTTEIPNTKAILSRFLPILKSWFLGIIVLWFSLLFAQNNKLFKKQVWMNVIVDRRTYIVNFNIKKKNIEHLEKPSYLKSLFCMVLLIRRINICKDYTQVVLGFMTTFS